MVGYLIAPISGCQYLPQLPVRLQPNTRYSTDVVLLGHSMGGILAAEVSLKPSNSPATGQPFHHRILGTVNFDTPFLGIHPGVISSGISSLFRSAPETPGTKERQSSIPGSVHGSDQTAASLKAQGPLTGEEELYSPTTLVPSVTSPLSSPSSHDPSFDPPFPNDIRLKERSAWSSLMHFLNKHSDNLPAATRQYFMSHLEFGSCLADYPGLKNRCERLHALEDVDELAGLDRPGYRRPVRRIRFVNYYTASTGRPKAPKEPNISPRQISEKDDDDQLKEYEMINMGLDHPRSASLMSTPSVAPDEQIHVAVAIPDRLSSQIVGSPTQAQVKSPHEESLENEGKFDMHQIEPAPLDDSFHSLTLTDVTNGAEAVRADLARELNLGPALPPIPDMPTEPEPIDLSLYTDKDARKIAEKEQKRLMKVYQQALRDRDIAIKDRKKLADKREKKARQELEKKLKEEEAKRLKEEKEHGKRKASLQPPSFPGEQAPVSPSQPKQDGKPKKERKFCMLPPKRGGLRDKCWVRVYMEGVDEVGAHCGLFSSGPHYETLVQGVAERIEGWVHEDALRRIAVEGEGGD